MYLRLNCTDLYLGKVTLRNLETKTKHQCEIQINVILDSIDTNLMDKKYKERSCKISSLVTTQDDGTCNSNATSATYE